MNPGELRQLSEGERLLIAAFEAARAKGREDWHRMTTPVLKNRLLSLTNRQFDERDWDAPTFRHFLALFPNLIELDTSGYPAIVHLIGDASEERQGPSATTATPMTARVRVRPDFWRAVLDYSSGTRYVWDEHLGAPVPSDDESDRRPRLPTVSREQYAKWRDDFANAQAKIVTPTQAAATERWRAEELPTTQLPSPVRGQWNAELKRRVLELLEGWFGTVGLSPPDDLVITDGADTTPRSAEADALREFALRCIRVMTREELERLALPIAAVLRTRQ